MGLTIADPEKPQVLFGVFQETFRLSEQLVNATGDLFTSLP